MNNEINERFIIGKTIKEFILLLNNYLINYPKREFELRNRLVNDSYNLLELVYLANYKEVGKRREIQLEAMMKINMIDFYLEYSYKKEIISKKQLSGLSFKLSMINKMMYKWLENEKC